MGAAHDATTEGAPAPQEPAAPGEPEDLWLPNEPTPPGGWPAAPDAVPCVVSEWVRRPARRGVLDTRPVHTWLPRAAAAVSAEDWGVGRVRRFARAWAIVAALRRLAPDADQPCRACVRRLVRAGVLAEPAGRTIGRPEAVEARTELGAG